MAKHRSRQCRLTEKANVPAVARIVRAFLSEMHLTQREFAILSGFSEARLSRLLNNTNSRGGSFELTEEDIKCLAAGMRKGDQGYMQLQKAAYPIYFSALANKDGYTMLKCRLDEEDGAS